MDYVTLEGIENRTGIEKENAYAFVLKELLDNATDFLETQYSSNSTISRRQKLGLPIIPATAEVQVTILKEDNNFLRVMVINSNEYGKSVFSKDMLNSIFNFNSFYSSKRNQYKISRGALGDALKEVLCIPYALAREQQQEWNEPLVITTNVKGLQQSFLVNLIVNRIDQTTHSQITESEDEKSTQHEKSNYTAIEVRLPIVQHLLDLDKLKRFLIEYATPNTHIGFTFNLPVDLSTKADEQNKITLNFSQVQPINNEWTNSSSVYRYTLPEFQNFIFGLHDEDLPIYSIIQRSFREGTNMKKEGEFAEMTLGQLKRSPNHVDLLYTQLRSIMKPPLNLSLPFDANRKVRMEALSKRLEQRQPSIKISDMKYKAKYGYYKSNGMEYPFFFEIAVVQSIKIPYYLDYIHSLNSSVIPGDYSFLTGSDNETFRWQTQGDKKNNTFRASGSIFDIFHHYGYSGNKEKCKKPRSLIIANLISPRIDYKSYGKSSIDLAPFADIIAEATVKTCSGSNRSTGRLSNANEEASSVIGFLRRLLNERYEAIKKDPTLKDTQKWTQSTVFYLLRRILLDHGFSVETIDRQYITSEIKDVCEKYLGVKREELGISAADRAQLYFKGEWHNVGLEEIGNLVQYGTDMLIIEKEGVVKQLAPFADEKGIALLNTRGFLTEYASILSEESSKNGCNIAILTDLDASGLLIANTIPDIFRVGIDFDVLDYFDLDPSIVEEKYNPMSNHLKPLKALVTRISHDNNLFDQVTDYDNGLSKKVEYVSSKRIEIDSVMATVNDNAKFWDFILSKLQEKFPTRNYNRAINVPEYVMPTIIESLNEMVREKVIVISEKERLKLKEEFSNTDGFLDVKQYDLAVKQKLRTTIENDTAIKPFLKKISSLVKGGILPL